MLDGTRLDDGLADVLIVICICTLVGLLIWAC